MSAENEHAVPKLCPEEMGAHEGRDEGAGREGQGQGVGQGYQRYETAATKNFQEVADPPRGRTRYYFLKRAKELGIYVDENADRPRIHSADDYRAHLDKVEGGFRSSRALQAVGLRCAAFFEELTPDDFRRIAALIYDTATRESSPAQMISKKVRHRAIIAALNSINNMVKLIPKLRKANNTRLLQHLELLCAAFFAELDDEKFRTMARNMVAGFSVSNKSRGAPLRRALDLWNITLQTMEALSTIVQKKGADENAPCDDPEIDAALERMKQVAATVTDSKPIRSV